MEEPFLKKAELEMKRDNRPKPWPQKHHKSGFHRRRAEHTYIACGYRKGWRIIMRWAHIGHCRLWVCYRTRQ